MQLGGLSQQVRPAESIEEPLAATFYEIADCIGVEDDIAKWLLRMTKLASVM